MLKCKSFKEMLIESCVVFFCLAVETLLFSKMKNPGRWVGGGGVLCEIPCVVGVWIFSGTTQFLCIKKCHFFLLENVMGSIFGCLQSRKSYFLPRCQIPTLSIKARAHAVLFPLI